MERERIGPNFGDDFFWDDAADRASFDGSGDRETPTTAGTEPAQTTQPKPNPKTVRKAGNTSKGRIASSTPRDENEALATPAGPGNPMRDRKVVNELHRAAPDEAKVDLPYDAHVTTIHNPLRLRASASLSAAILAHMPKGHVVKVTGKSVNHFRPVTYIDAAHPDKPFSGWAFTTYLSPPKLKAEPVTTPEKKPEKKPVEVGLIASVEVHAEEEAIPLVPTPILLNEITLRPTPQVSTPEPVEAKLPATDTAIAGRVTDDIKKLNGPTPVLTSGLHYKDQYRQALVAAGRGAEWNAGWESGHTESKLWDNPSDTKEPFLWKLKEGASASEGLKQWLAGLTVADCTTGMVAIELDAVRAVVGNKIFDRCFGNPAGKAKVAQLTISQRLSQTPLFDLLRFTDGARGANKQRGEMGKRPVKAGEWYYFYNHPDYVEKHPGGAWRGENALCLGDQNGKQMWSGLGATYDEEGMLRALLAQYNAPRDGQDFAWLKDVYTTLGNWPQKYKDGFAATDAAVTPAPNNGARDVVNVDQLVDAQKKLPSAVPPDPSAGAYQPIVTTSKQKQAAGLDVSTGMVLSTSKLADLVRTYGDDDPVDAPDDVI